MPFDTASRVKQAMASLMTANQSYSGSVIIDAALGPTSSYEIVFLLPIVHYKHLFMIGNARH